MPFYVYILKSLKDNSFYIGQTKDIIKRFANHNSKKCKSTKSKVPWELIHIEEFPTRKEAMQREKEIKKRKKRKFIEKIIN